MALTRNQEHYVVMTVIYDELSDFVLGDGKEFRDARQLLEISPYVKNVVAYSLNNYGAIKDVFTPHLVKWKWERLPLLTQSILLMSYAHSKVTNDDKVVIINIAVNLAKKYIEEKQAKFINAILDGVL